ncbi:MAG: hypothetical protein ACOXZQ_10120 [Bacteroidales bacterium]
MSHPSLEIENWKIINFNNEFVFSYNNTPVGYVGLKIDSVKFYFFLKEKFKQPPNIQYSQVSSFLPKKKVTTGNDWCYLFQSGTNYTLVSGDDSINITVFSINEPPEKLDFDIFCSNINALLGNLDISQYDNASYNIYVNYAFLLRNLIEDYKAKIFQRLPALPKTQSIHVDDINTDDPVKKNEMLEYSSDYNHWLKATLDRATVSLQIQILLPIHFESLVDLAFRLKLQRQYFDERKVYGRRNQPIFKYFVGLNLIEKLKEIQVKCFSINEEKMVSFITAIKKDEALQQRRNKMLHGNSVFLRNLNLKYYFDDNRIIGFPDRHKAERIVTESVYNSLAHDDIFDFIKKYEIRCKKFIDIFDDNGYFKNLVDGIVFGHNPKTGGALGIGFNKIEDLFLPTEI